MNRRVAVLIEDQYQELEVWYPALRLREEGAEVKLVGRSQGHTHPGKYGYPAQADLGFAQALQEDFDAVVVPGGFAPDYLRRVPEPARLVRRMHEEGKVVAAICHGGWLLASAKILQGKRVTCFHAIQDDLVHAGARYEDREVVVDGSLITSRKPEDLPAFCRAILEALRRPTASTR